MDNVFQLSGITQDHIDRLIAQLNNQDTVMTVTAPDQWSISGHGVEAVAQFAPDTGILTVNIQRKPWYISISFIQSSLQENLN